MYKNILVAIDLTEVPSARVLECAKSLMGADSRLFILHVIEPPYAQYSFDPSFTGSMIHTLEERAKSSAIQRLAELCDPFAIEEVDQYVDIGHPATLIHEFSRTRNCDLIIVGTHGHRGWQRILGSTANAVLHGTQIDVYVCRIASDPSD